MGAVGPLNNSGLLLDESPLIDLDRLVAWQSENNYYYILNTTSCG